jgi:cytoplasmic iron level regulating protein YaaA (DUF328/UPF0246 family)
MIIVATFLLLFGGGSATFDVLIDRVEQHVSDPQSAKQVEALIEDADKALINYGKQIDDISDKIAALNADYHADEADYAAVADQAFQNYNAVADKILDLRFEMKSHMSREEWASVFGGQ